MSALNKTTVPVSLRYATTGSASRRSTGNKSLDYSNACIPGTNTPGPASDSRFVNASWNDTTAASGSHPSPDRDLLSSSPSRNEPSSAPHRHQILIVEDHKPDVFLIRESITAASLDAELQVVD